MSGDASAVGVVEDVLLALGEGDVGEGLADGVGDFGEDEASPRHAGQRRTTARDRDRLGGDDVAPSVVRFLIDGGVNGALEGEIVREGVAAAGHGDGEV